MKSKQIVLMVLVLVLGVVLLAAAYPEHAREYRLYLSESRPAVVLDFSNVSAEWTEEDLQSRFNRLAFRCYDNRPGEYLDERSCFADISSLNGHGAMSLAFYLKNGKVNQAVVNVPWWSHWSAYEGLEEQYGKPAASQPFPMHGVRLHGWRLPKDAAIFFNRDVPLNPLQWSGIYWRSARECEMQGCFLGQKH